MAVKLDNQHWTFVDYKQRMLVKDWKELLLHHDDKIIYQGKLTQLVVEDLGYGVLEVSKKLD